MRNIKINKRELLCSVVVFLCVFLGMIISNINHNLAAGVICVGAIGGGCYLWYLSKNLMNILSLMFWGFVLPLGVSNFKIASYQSTWTYEAWACFLGAILLFSIAYCLRECLYDFLYLKTKKIKCIKVRVSGRYNLVFAIILFALMISAFLVKLFVAKSLPLFNWEAADTYIRFLSGEGYLLALQKRMSNYPVLFLMLKAYHRFSTIFLFQGWLISCLIIDFWKRKRKEISLFFKIMLVVIIACCIIMPVLIVCREIFLMNTVSLAVYLYVVNREYKWKVLFVIFLAMITVGGFVVLSKARGYSDSEISQVFEMNIVEEKLADSSRQTEEELSGQNEEELSEENKKELSGTVVWIYTYFTAGYDGFSYLTKSLDYRTYGLMQLRPIFSALQIKGLKDIDERLQNPKYRVSPNITINTFLSDAYLDFGVLGVYISMFFWGLVFGLIEFMALKNGQQISMFVYAALAHHTIFMCFVPWMGHFSYLCSFGLLFILYLLEIWRNRNCSMIEKE